MRDTRGFKRKIEYIDDSESENEDDLAYSKSVLKSKVYKGSQIKKSEFK